MTAKNGFLKKVDFSPPFPPGSKPIVLIGFYQLDSDSYNKANTRVKIEAQDVDANGFWVSFSSWADSKVWGCAASWLAFLSPKHTTVKWTHGATSEYITNSKDLALPPHVYEMIGKPSRHEIIDAYPPLAIIAAPTLIDQDQPVQGQGFALERRYSSLQVSPQPNCCVCQLDANVLVGELPKNCIQGTAKLSVPRLCQEPMLTDLSEKINLLDDKYVRIGTKMHAGTLKSMVFMTGYYTNNHNVRVNLTHRIEPPFLHIQAKSWAGTKMYSVSVEWLVWGEPVE